MDKFIPDKIPFYYGWVITGVSLVMMMVAYGIWWSFPMFYVSILNEFGWSRGSTATIFTVGSVVYGFGSLAAGAFIDRFGPRKLFPAACILLAVGCLISSFSSQKWHFFVAYGVFMGFGVICAGYVPVTAVLSNWFVRKRGAALGVGLVGNVSPPILAFPVQYLISLAGWRGSYIVLAVVTLLVIAPLTSIFMRSRPQELGLEPDGRNKKVPSVRSHREGRKIEIVNQEWAATEWSLFKGMKTYPFWLLVGVMSTLGTGAGIIMHHLVAVVVDTGHSGAMAAFIFSLAGFMAATGRLGGFLADRLGREVTFSIVTGLYLGSALALLIFIGNARIWPLYLYAITFGLGSGLGSPTVSTGAADLFGGRNFGSILGFANIGFGLGHGLGAWTGGAIFDLTGSYRLAVMAAIPLFILMCLFFWAAGPRKVRKIENPGNESRS
ncbi:MAG: MFS transporter [Deltaproteobacteria bacterium]|nr:MFS transporter [Deltaproteobacteria bacterium]